MRYAYVAFTVLAVTFGVRPCLAAAASTAAPGVTQIAAQHKKPVPVRGTSSNGNAVTYNGDSKNPNEGWHTVNGMRECTQDCDNPEIPGSGYTCRNVNILGMAMRECDWSSF